MGKRFSRILAAALTVAFFGSVPSFAATTPSNAQGVQIGPTLVNLSVAPGGLTSFTVTVMNVTDKTLTFTGTVDDFTSKDETGTPQINLGGSLPSTISVKSWVTPVAPFTLGPYKSRVLAVMVTAAATAEAGGHYGVLRFSGTEAAKTGDGVAVTVSAGTLMLIKVNGDILEHLSPATFTTTNKSGDHIGIFESSPIYFETRLRNDGTTHVSPRGVVTVTDMFGRPVDRFTVNDTGGYVLPGSTRRFDSTLTHGWMFGRYTANLSVAYGTTGGAVERTAYFWVVPYRLILLVLIVLAVIFIGGRAVLRRHTKRAVERAMREKND